MVHSAQGSPPLTATPGNRADTAYVLSRYLHAHKKAVRVCEGCGQPLQRAFLRIDQQGVSRYTLSQFKMRMTQRGWQRCQQAHTLQVLCRSCYLIPGQASQSLFDLWGFKAYLRETVKVKGSTVNEYLARLKRLSLLLQSLSFSMPVFSRQCLHAAIIDHVSMQTHMNMGVVLTRYEDYLAYQAACSRG